MAIPCQGMTLTWGGASLSEVASFDSQQFTGLPIGRTTTWTPELGTVNIAGFSTANLPTTDYGRRKRLTITAPTSTAFAATVNLFDSDCIFQGYRVSGVVNNAVEYAFTFRVMDTVGAPSNP